MGIASLDTATPTSSTLASTGAADIRALRVAIRETFVNFGIGTDVVTATAAQINGAPNKAGAETISGAWNFTSGTTMNGISNAVGTEALPAYSFSSDPDTGIYSESSNVVNVATSGGKRLSVTATELRSFQPVWSPPGSQTVPAFTFTGATTTGIYQNGGASIGFTVNGTERGYFRPDGGLQLINGVELGVAATANLASATSVTVPTVTPSTDSTTKAASTAFVQSVAASARSYASMTKSAALSVSATPAELATWVVGSNLVTGGSDVTPNANGQITVNTTGVYRVDFNCVLGTASNGLPKIELRKGGSALTVPVYVNVNLDTAATALSSQSFSVVLDLSATNYLSLYVSGSGLGDTTMTNAHFTVQRIA